VRLLAKAPRVRLLAKAPRVRLLAKAPRVRLLAKASAARVGTWTWIRIRVLRLTVDAMNLLLESSRAGIDLRLQRVYMRRLIRTFRCYTDRARLIAKEGAKEDGGSGSNKGRGSMIEAEEDKPLLRILHLIMNGGAALKLLKHKI
jgi:hypothetical protein